MKQAQTTNFRGRTIPAETLSDLLIVEIAIREQSRLDERRMQRTEAAGASPGLSGRGIARHEAWDVTEGEIDRACTELARQRFLIPVPENPGADLASGRMVLSSAGRDHASKVAPTYLDGSLPSLVEADPAFEGIGQVTVDFLSSQFVIGCVQGEEAKALRLAERFEIDAGEVTKAVSADIDDVRAMLMAGVRAYERLEEFEDPVATVPAADRVVGLDHNSAHYVSAIQTLDVLIVAVRESNHYREHDEPDQERRLAELEAGRALLNSRWVSATSVKAALWGTLAYLATKFIDAPIGEAASLAWTAVKRLLGVG